MNKTFFFLFLCLFFAICCNSPYGLPHVAPEQEGMSSETLSNLDTVFCNAIARKEFPGAVVCVLRNGKIVYEKAYGVKQALPVEEGPMTVGTIFDLASVSKCVGTTLSFMQLVEGGKVSLDDEVRKYFPEFTPWVDPQTGEEVHVTVKNLLTHTSGLDSYNYLPWFLEGRADGTPESMMHCIATQTGCRFRPGTDYLYSCLNFVTLQFILEKVTGERLCDYAKKNVFDVLGLKNTHYFPIGYDFDSKTLSSIAPTQIREGDMPLRGQVHDPLANKLNHGNSGNAGVFSNVEDLAIIAAALMNGGEWNSRRILKKETVDLMFSVPEEYPSFIGRGLGWNFWNGSYSFVGDTFSARRTASHSGYTGTSIAMDLDSGVALIILTNRVHPDGKGNAGPARRQASDVVGASLQKRL